MLVTAAAQLLVSWQELAGTPLSETMFGLPTLGLFACLGVVALSWLVRAATVVPSPDFRQAETGESPADVARRAAGIVTETELRDADAAFLRARLDLVDATQRHTSAAPPLWTEASRRCSCPSHGPCSAPSRRGCTTTRPAASG